MTFFFVCGVKMTAEAEVKEEDRIDYCFLYDDIDDFDDEDEGDDAGLEDDGIREEEDDPFAFQPVAVCCSAQLS